MSAALNGHTECVQLLLSAGADINIQNKVSNILLSLFHGGVKKSGFSTFQTLDIAGFEDSMFQSKF